MTSAPILVTGAAGLIGGRLVSRLVADGVAVISALSLAPDPAGAAQRLRGLVDRSLRARADP